MKTSMMLAFAAALAVTPFGLAGPAAAADAACVKKEQAKGATACIAKAKCDGITSKKEQAKRCNG